MFQGLNSKLQAPVIEHKIAISFIFMFFSCALSVEMHKFDISNQTGFNNNGPKISVWQPILPNTRACFNQFERLLFNRKA